MNTVSTVYFEIREPRLHERQCWLSLWYRYLDFYQVDWFSHKATERLWQRIQNPRHEIRALVALNQGKPCGFVHFLTHSNTWYEEPVCYLEDLFVADSARGQGVGEALIQEVVNIAKENGWATVYWQTKQDNGTARRLYDKVTGGTDGFVTYRVSMTNPRLCASDL